LPQPRLACPDRRLDALHPPCSTAPWACLAGTRKYRLPRRWSWRRSTE